MKKRLKYEKVNNSNDVISIDLYNGYSIIAVSGRKEDNIYTTTLFIKDNKFTTLRQVEENIKFAATYKTINSAILKYVSDLLENETIDKYIESYSFEEECTSRGIEIVEKEKYGEKSYPVRQSKIAYRTVYYCSSCDGDLGDNDTENYPYCPHCRVLLDWNNVLDEDDDTDW